MATMAMIGKTANYTVYFQKQKDGNRRFYFEHEKYGDADGQVAIVGPDDTVVDLDMCGVLGKEPADYLRTMGVDTDGAAVDDN